jgi:hypothetical protein
MSGSAHNSLESSVRNMTEALARLTNRLNSQDSANDLMAIIHRPGWTTPQEAALVEAMAVAIGQHADALTRSHKALIEAALAIGQS